MLRRLAILALVIPALTACNNRDPGRLVDATLDTGPSVPAVLRGTIGTRGTLIGAQPVLVSGFGLVVGLNGTGGGLIPEGIMAHMERELALMGVGDANIVERGSFLWNMSEGRPSTPSEVLRDPDVAVVVVRAAIPPGAPKGSPFDVQVTALPSTSVTSLEGGRLWTTRLQLGEPSMVGGRQTRIVAEASGPLFINPFKDPVVGEIETRRDARVLGGGRVTDPLELAIVLDTDFHQTARFVTSSINSRFPPGPGDSGPTARGLGRRGSAGSELMTIALRVPAAYAERPAEFIRIVEFLQIDAAFPQEYAQRYVRGLKEQPFLADSLSWALEGVGSPALPFIRQLYDYPESAPRLAALRAGAHLNDPLAARPLIDVATSGNRAMRAQAIGLLGRLDGGPIVDVELRQLAASEALDIRIAAYESLAMRAERAELRRMLAQDRAMPGGAGGRSRYQAIAHVARHQFTGYTAQDIRRVAMVDEESDEVKFVVDLVPYGEPMIYVALQRQPRVALFGDDLALEKPLLASAWNNRFMLAADSPTEQIRMFYRDPRTGQTSITTVDEDLLRLIQTLAFTPTHQNDPVGLGFSYSEVVGALSAIQESKALDAGFVTEQERLTAALLAASETYTVADRPETEGQTQEEFELPPIVPTGQDVGRGPQERKSLVVPIERPAANQDGS